MTFDGTGNLYTTNFTRGCTPSPSEFASDGSLLGPFGGTQLNCPESIIQDAAGNFYVGQGGSSCGSCIVELDPSGQFVNEFRGATQLAGNDWIDLAADQCTMLYTSESSSILSYNICTNQQNTPFVSALPAEPNGGAARAFALRIRPNGEVLVATQTLGGGVGVVYRLDALGNLIQSYNVNNETGLFALNLDPDGATFWTAGTNTGTVYRVDIASGTIVAQFGTGQSVSGLAIYQEQMPFIPRSRTGRGVTGGTTPRPSRTATPTPATTAPTPTVTVTVTLPAR